MCDLIFIQRHHCYAYAEGVDMSITTTKTMEDDNNEEQWGCNPSTAGPLCKLQCLFVATHTVGQWYSAGKLYPKPWVNSLSLKCAAETEQRNIQSAFVAKQGPRILVEFQALTLFQ